MIRRETDRRSKQPFLLAGYFLLMLLLPASLQAGAPLQAASGKEDQAQNSSIRSVAALHNDTSPTLLQMGGAIDHTVTSKSDVPNDPAAPSAMPAPIANFDGVANSDNRQQQSRPDTAGDVGLNHYVQWVNSTLAIYDKGGNRLFGPVPGSTIWDGFGGACDATNDGTPAVIYDSIADRWLLSQFSLPNYPDPPYYQCVAVSTTPDPLGSYHRYEFLISDRYLNNDARFGLWPDGYYASFSMTDSLGGAGAGSWAVVFDRAQMLVGQPASLQIFQMPPAAGTFLPSDLDGSRLPPAGAPNVYAALRQNALNLYNFHVDWANANNSSFSQLRTLATEPFTYLCLGRADCIAQPDGAPALEGVGDRLLNRLAYRNFGDHEALTAVHAVDSGSGSVRAGLRWYEIRQPAGSAAIFQQGTLAPDDTNRWLGSAALDGSGNLALGYSVASSSVFPGLRYSGRLAGDPLGNLAQGEGTLINGGGAQLPFSFNPANRWGSTAVMSIDPADDCTFWFTSEYIANTGTANWRTRIGSFKFPSCAPTTPTATPTGTPPTAVSTPTPRIIATSTPPVVVTPNGDACQIYNYSSSTGATLVPGTTDSGNHCDECTTSISLPFQFTLYDQSFSNVTASPNGTLSFLGGGSGYNNACLPYRYANYAIYADWDDQITSGAGKGIFTSVSGTAPNRIFNIEWRTCLYTSAGCGGDLNYEVRLYEGQPDRFDIIYGAVANGGRGATIGVQKGRGSSYTQYSCNTESLTAGQQLTFRLPVCGLPCPITFSDVRTTDYFYNPVRYLFCSGAISGYNDNTFRPYNPTTRGQLAKIIVAARGWDIDTTGGPHFSDVTPNNTFYSFIETAYNRGIIGGYSDNTFRWGNNVTRGQLSKIIVLAMGWDTSNPVGPHFGDVSPGNPFYPFVETAFQRQIISGYSDGNFRPGNDATRAQISKITYQAITNDQ